MKIGKEFEAARLLWKLYPRRDAFVRRRQFSWSAEIVDLGQVRPPYRTCVVAETGSLDELIAKLGSPTP